MSLPREVLPGRFYMMTRRCTQRLLLMRPDQPTNKAFLYCLALAAGLFNIDVLITCAMSNHHHTVIFDRDGNYPLFLEYFHKLFARSQNALRGRRENFWASGQASVVRLVEAGDVMRKVIYTALNPVKDHLVEQVSQWPGANTYADLLVGREVVIERPKHFFRGKDRGGALPETVTLRCHIPAELGVNVEAFLSELRTSVEAAERKHAVKRRAIGKRVLGAPAILAQLWWRSPTSEDESVPHRSEPRQSRRLVASFKIKPTLAAKSAWARVEALARNHEFVENYRRARRAWLDKRPIAFPPGTYWLRRFAGVTIDPIDRA